MSKLDELIHQLAHDDESYPVARPVDPRQGVPIDNLFASRTRLFAEALSEIEDRLYRLEYARKQHDLNAAIHVAPAVAQEIAAPSAHVPEQLASDDQGSAEGNADGFGEALDSPDDPGRPVPPHGSGP